MKGVTLGREKISRPSVEMSVARPTACQILNSNSNVTKRSNKDQYVNNRGKRLIELCNSIDLHIMNGRYGADKGIGKTTCKNASVVDYILISENLAPYVEKFDILEFDYIISDIHCPVNAVFNLVLEKEDDLSNKTFHTRSEHVIKYKWKSDPAASFQSNVPDECIELILHTMDRAEAEGNITADVVSKVSDDICKVLKQSATASGLSHEVKVSAKKPRRRALPHKPWYNTEYEEARRNMLKYRNKYRRLKNTTHFNEVRVYSKQYKKTVNKAFREYKKATINKLRTLQSKNPKEYWSLIQGKTKQVNEIKISLDIFEQHFKKLASETESTNQTEACHREELNVADDPDLDKPFTTQEITKAIKKLKSHKSSGIDQIINEFFKHSPDKLIPVYAKLFNIILSTGIVGPTRRLGY